MTYREGNHPDIETGPRQESIDEAFKRDARGSEPPPVPEEQGTGIPVPEEKLYTAVLLVQTMGGQVLPITNLPHLDLHHEAIPHEVFRMASDTVDQISSVRIIGEILRHMKGDHQDMANWIVHALGGGPPPPQRPRQAGPFTKPTPGEATPGANR